MEAAAAAWVIWRRVIMEFPKSEQVEIKKLEIKLGAVVNDKTAWQ